MRAGVCNRERDAVEVRAHIAGIDAVVDGRAGVPQCKSEWHGLIIAKCKRRREGSDGLRPYLLLFKPASICCTWMAPGTRVPSAKIIAGVPLMRYFWP